MIDISVSGVVKSFQIGETVLNGVTFQINEGERVGILGKNGSGKTTLFKILTGEYFADDGDVMIAPGKRIGLISQIPVYPDHYTVEDVLDTAFERIHAIEEELRRLTDRMAAGESDEVAAAIRDHYRPRFAGDELPEGLAGCIVAAAD